MPFGPMDPSAGDLVRRCGADLNNRRLWSEFQRRFQRRIFLYLYRASRAAGHDPDHTREHLRDLAQEVYVRLLQNDGRRLKLFRKDSELAVRAFLARIATAVVSDHFRYQSAEKRQAQVIPIDEARQVLENWTGVDPTDGQVDSVLSWIDVERRLDAAGDRGRVARDVLLFKLYYVDGFTAEELAAFPGFQLSVQGIESAVNRIRVGLKRGRKWPRYGA